MDQVVTWANDNAERLEAGDESEIRRSGGGA
jgi:hypothetical protein